MADYSATYQKKQDFYNWCKHWIDNGSVVRLNYWKPMYSSVAHIEKNTPALYKKYGVCLLEKQRDFFVRMEDGTHGFMSKKAEEELWKWKTMYSGTKMEWRAKIRKATEELFA